VNIRIEGPVAVVDRNVDQRGTRKAAEALAAYLQTPEAQRIFAEQGFRPVNRQVWQEVKNRFAPVPKPFTVAAFGGWEAVDTTFFAKAGGLWEELFGQARR
jgi:sulfate transport system substrate-binding protein